MGEDGMLTAVFGCCCGGAGFGEELYKDWESHPACQQYTTLKRLGEGGFAEVHLAQDKLTGRTVALKVVFLNKAGLTKNQKKILAGEARLVRMVAHPHIVRCMQVLETCRQQVLVLEHLSGGEMLKQLQRMKRYSEANACQIFKQIADAVAYLHSLGILHRDIKPENCLLAKPAAHYLEKHKTVKVKLIDLGMAGLYRPNRPVHGCMGSPGFIAPEVIIGEPHSPAMDIYSLGVLLFIMLVGRKPWDAQRSHTLAYAVQRTCEAPGLRDPVFVGLSGPAKQLVLWMLAEDPSRRPTAQQVLGHSWILQGGCCKAEGGSSSAAAASASGPQRVYQQVVQHRLQVLAHSRDIMGTARGMMLLHGSGSRSQAVMFHRAVKAARVQLQQQAAALQASGQLPAVDGAQGAASLIQQQQQDPTAAAVAPAGAAASKEAAAPEPTTDAAAAAATNAGVPDHLHSSATPAPAPALQRSSAPVAAAKAASTSSAATMAAVSRGLPRSMSADEMTTTSNDAAAGEPAASRTRKSVAQLACEDLQRRQGVLFTALHQQQQPPPQPLLPSAGRRGPRGVSTPGSIQPGPTGHHRSTASEGRAVPGSSAVKSGRGSAAVGAGADAVAAPARPIAIDVNHLHIDALERGMSAPNVDALPFSPPAVDTEFVGPRRLQWAVSVSPGALALLDADDQLCLLQAAGSIEDEGAAMLAAGVLSWGRRGAADMVASFKQRYPVVRSIARFGQSLSRSLTRGIKSPHTLSAAGSGRYMDAAAAAVAAEAHSELTSAQTSVTAAAGPAADWLVPASAATPPAEDTDEQAQPCTAPVQTAAVTQEQQQQQQQEHTQPVATQVQPALLQQSLSQQLHVSQCDASAKVAAAASRSAVRPILDAQLLPQGITSARSAEQQGAYLGAPLSVESSYSNSLWYLGMGSFSPGSSLRCSNSDACAVGRAPHEEHIPQAHQPQQGNQQQQTQQQHLSHHMAQHRLAVRTLAQAKQEHQRLQNPALAQDAAGAAPLHRPEAAADVTRKPSAAAGVAAGGEASLRVSQATDPDIARASAGSAASSGGRPSAFATFGGFAAATAASLGDIGSSSQQPSASSAGRTLAALQSPSIRAAATAAAARAEEEGIGLPNGLWLQQSQSINASTAAAVLQLLTKDPAAAGAAVDAGVLSEAGSVALMHAGSSRTLSGPLSPRRTQSGSAPAMTPPPGHAATAAGYADSVVGDGSCEPAAGPAEMSSGAVEGCVPAAGRVSHSRDISMMSWLPGAEVVLAEPVTAGVEGCAAAQMDSLSGASRAEQAGAQPWSGTSATGLVPGSRAVRVPHGAQGARSHRNRPQQTWLPSPEQPTDGSRANSGSRQRQSSAGDEVVPHHTSFQGPAEALDGATATAAGLGIIGLGGAGSADVAAGGMLEHAPSVTASSVEQEFYVGSFWSPKGLAVQAGSRGQQLQQRQQALRCTPGGNHLARSTSSLLDRLDSLPDSLALGIQCNTLELEDASSALQSPAGNQGPSGHRAGGVGAGRRPWSSSAGGGALDGVLRAATQGSCGVDGDGLLEGCLPADSSADPWQHAGHVLQQEIAGAAVLVRVHSGAAAAESGSSAVKSFTAASVGGCIRDGVGETVQITPAISATALTDNYSWVAKAVVSRVPQQQQEQQQQLQFDAFDELNGGEWYYHGS